jgi:hypothetical protein
MDHQLKRFVSMDDASTLTVELSEAKEVALQ